jgi:uncharacterized protein involved in exopolysaccharide biosynthesis
LFDVGAAWRVLWSRRLLIAAVAAAVLALAIAYVVVTKPSYVSSAAVLIDPRDVKTTNIDSVLPGIGADSAAITSQVSVIKSRDFLRQIYADLKLATDADYTGSGMIGSLLSLFRGESAPNEEVAFQKFMGTVSVEREGLTYVITVGVRSGDPEKAARIANAIVDRYIAATANQQLTASTDVTATLKDKIAALQDDVTAAERTVEEFKQVHNILDDTTGGSLTSQVNQLSTQVIAAQDALNQAQIRYDQAAGIGTSPDAMARLGEITSSVTATKLRDDYNAAAAALATAQATYGPKHPNVITAQAQLNKFEGLLSREAGRILKELGASRDVAQSNLLKLQQDLDAARAQANSSSVAQVELRRLQATADAARGVLGDFQQRSQETAQMQGLESSQVHVISRAAAPTEPVWPKPALLLPVSAMLGLMMGAGIALLIGEPRTFAVLAPSPSPNPPAPTDHRKKAPSRVGQATPTLATVSPARRYARLDGAREDVVTGHGDASDIAMRRLLSEVLALLPRHESPFILSFAAQTDARLSRRGAQLAAAGLERIGADAAVVTGDVDVVRHRFALVDATNELAGDADLEILVIAEGERIRHPLSPTTIVFELPLARGFVTENEPALATG